MRAVWLDGGQLILYIETGAPTARRPPIQGWTVNGIPAGNGMRMGYHHELSWTNGPSVQGTTQRSRTYLHMFQIPLWPAIIATCLLTALVWWLDVLAHRRSPIGHCAMCGYDRTGMAMDAVCPECGVAASERQSTEAVMDTDGPEIPR